MAKALKLVGVVFLALALLWGLGGCCCAGGLPGLGGIPGLGGVELPQLETPEEGESVEEPPVEEPKPGPPAQKGLPDIPIYPGAKLKEGGDLPFWFKAMTGQYARLDWQMYLTDDKPGQVVSFYEKVMPQESWEGAAMGFGEGESAAGGAMLTYQKKDRPDLVALIMVGTEDGKTSIIVVRAESKK